MHIKATLNGLSKVYTHIHTPIIIIIKVMDFQGGQIKEELERGEGGEEMR